MSEYDIFKKPLSAKQKEIAAKVREQDCGELKPCPFCGCSQLSTKYSMDGGSLVYCQGCAAQGPKMPSSYISKWNQRQPHPDSVRLKWLVVNSATVYGFNSPCDGYAVVTTENEVETCTHDYGEAIDKAMEQEK